MHTLHFELHKLNRLDQRPSELLPTHPSEEDLARAFPFIFKPNWVAAVYPGDENTDHDSGWPVKDGFDRWLFKLTSQIPNLPICIFSLSPSGRLSLWRFYPYISPAQKSGFYRIPLKLQSEASHYVEDGCVRLHIFNPYSKRLELFQCAQASYGDDWHSVRIQTRLGRHVLELDLTTLTTAPNSNSDTEQGITCYYHHDKYENIPSSRQICRQIGGWNGGTAFYFKIPDLITRTSTDYKVKFQLWAALESEGDIFGGGDRPFLWHKIIQINHWHN
jgi:hypothetical protein